MELPQGFDREVIEVRESKKGIDFTDESVKKKVRVSPLKPGGSNFKTHLLVEKSPSKYLFKPSIGGALFSLLFPLLGLGFVIYHLVSDSGQFSSPSYTNFVTLTIGLSFIIIGIVMCYYMFKPRVFDKKIGYYYKGYKFQPQRIDLKNQLQLSSILALQIIGETVTDNDGSYGSFELNLVLNGGSRRNVVDHGNLRSIIDDAHILSEFLDVPIWHAKSGNNADIS